MPAQSVSEPDPAPFGWRYDRTEMVADGLVHAAGSILGVAGTLVLALRAVDLPGPQAAGVLIYGLGLLCMLGFSAAYNLWPISPAKWLLRRCDHAAIYLLIAGTYTPFMLRMGQSSAAYLLLAFVWSTALFGMVLKLCWPGRFDGLSIALCLLLSWSGLAAYPQVFAAIPSSSVWLLLGGGIAYSGGVVFHLWHRLRFQNAIWHLFVLAGATLHYFAVSGALVDAS